MKYLKKFKLFENNKIVKGVDFVFEQNPNLSSIGTPEQYSEYLETIFPDSSVKDIVWHGSRYTFDEFKKTNVNLLGLSNLLGLKLNRGTYFSNNIEHAKFFTVGKGKIYAAKIELKSPYFPKFDTVFYNQKKGDGFIFKNLNDANIGIINQYAVFEPTQIHILGSELDQKKFKEYISK
jgi:hypothetical protein